MKSQLSGKSCCLILALLLSMNIGCAAVRSTAVKKLEPARLKHSLSITVAGIRDVSEEAVSVALFSQEKRGIDLSEAVELKLGSLLQDSGSFSKTRIIPHSQIPENATELTWVSLGRKEGTDLVIHGEINHRASFSLNWLTLPSYVPGIVVGAPLWSPNYTLKGEVELTLHVLDVHSLERIFTRKFTEVAYSSICFLTRVTALRDRYVDLEKNVALHNAAVEAAKLLLKTLASYEPGRAGPEPASQGKVIAVVDFDPGSDFVKRMGYDTQAAEMFTTTLQNSGFFKVIERQRITDVLAERKFTMTDMVQDEKARQVAERLLGIDYLLLGSVAKLGGLLHLNVRLLDISTATVVVTKSDSISRDADLQILVELMTRRMIEEFAKKTQAPEK